MQQRFTSFWFAIFLVLTLGNPALSAESPNAEDLAWESYRASYFQGNDVRASVTLDITNEQEQTRTRELTLLRKNIDKKNQKYYSYFHEPSRLREMVFLVWTHSGQSDDRWLYLPSIDVTQRITGSQKRNSFAGSNFTYEDMTGRYPDNDSFEYLGLETYEEQSVHLLKGTPKNADRVEFAYYKVRIDTATKLPLKAVFYTPQGKPHRTLTIEETRKIGGYLTPVVQKAVNHQTGSTSIATMEDVEYELGLPERVFEKRYLRRPPTPWIQP